MANSPSSETLRQQWIRPFDIAALAAALSICRSLAKPSPGTNAEAKPPKYYIEDAYELLQQAEDLLNRRHRDSETDQAVEDYITKAQLDATYSWDEVLKIQDTSPDDGGSLQKFCPGPEWQRLLLRGPSRHSPFTNDDLVNRPKGYTMVGNLASEKSLRMAIRVCFPESAKEMIRLKTLSVEQINAILLRQLNTHDGEVPAAMEPKARQ
jgi:hypothetical protein